MSSVFTSAAYIQAHFRLEFFIKVNDMNTDQTAPKEQSAQDPYCKQYRLHGNISRRNEQTAKVVTSVLSVNIVSSQR